MYHLFFSSLDLIFGCQPWLQGYDRTMKYDLIISKNIIRETVILISEKYWEK